MAEHGLVAPVGHLGLQKLIDTNRDQSNKRVPALARTCQRMVVVQLELVNAQALRPFGGFARIPIFTEFRPS